MHTFFYDPLEQFDIVIALQLSWYLCICFYFLQSNVSLVGYLNLFFFFFLVFSVQSSLKGKIIWGSIIVCIVEALKTILHGNMGFKKQIFLGYLVGLFFFILFSNVFGMIPYNVTVTSYFVLSFFFSLITFISVCIVGVRYHRFKILKLFIPDGVPFVIALLLVLIELISFFSRVLSLAIRLFANMLSGHTLLKILLGFFWSALQQPYNSLFISYNPVWIIPLVVLLAVTCLESMIAFLQAYIFIVLSSIYFNDVVNLH